MESPLTPISHVVTNDDRRRGREVFEFQSATSLFQRSLPSLRFSETGDVRRFEEQPVAINTDTAIPDMVCRRTISRRNARVRGRCARQRPRHYREL